MGHKPWGPVIAPDCAIRPTETTMEEIEGEGVFILESEIFWKSEVFPKAGEVRVMSGQNSLIDRLHEYL